MNSELQERFERSCRLCALEQEASIPIFSNEPYDLNLPIIIKKYLKIEVKLNDFLPKNICLQCCNKLQTVTTFIENAQVSQQVLNKQRSLLYSKHSDDLQQTDDFKTNHDCNLNEKPIKKEDFKDTNDFELKNNDDFMKSDSEKHLEAVQIFDRESDNITELEVNVDPMFLLQNDEPEDETSQDAMPIKLNVSGDVTLTLIKKPNTNKDLETNDCLSPPNEQSTSNNDAKVENGSCQEQSSVQKPFPCPKCMRSFLSEIALKSHLWCHVNLPDTEVPSHKFQCYTCRFDFQTRKELLEHYKSHKHLMLHCNICARSFRTEENLKLHLESHRTNARIYTCKVCGRTYKTLSNLKTHSVTHSSDRPFKCIICKKGFKRNQDLKFHINQHTGAKPYKCPYCDRCFASSGNCYSHRNRMHPGLGGSIRQQYVSRNDSLPAQPSAQHKQKKIYRCAYCPRIFTRRENLIYHTYQHNGKKPYRCEECNRCFLSHRSMGLHMYNDHNRMIVAASQLRKLITNVKVEEADDE